MSQTSQRRRPTRRVKQREIRYKELAPAVTEAGRANKACHVQAAGMGRRRQAWRPKAVCWRTPCPMLEEGRTSLFFSGFD